MAVSLRAPSACLRGVVPHAQQATTFKQDQPSCVAAGLMRAVQHKGARKTRGGEVVGVGFVLQSLKLNGEAAC